MSRPSRVPWPAVVALVPFVVVLVVPATRWVARAYLARISGPPPALLSLLWDLGVKELPGGGSPPKPSRASTAALAAAARRHPVDMGAQIVLASCDVAGAQRLNGSGAVPALRILAARHPDQPAILAYELDQEALGLHIGREKEQEYGTAPSPPGEPTFPSPPPSSASDLAAFEANAARGEKLDPGNAFFPYMRSIALFGLKRDGDALAALHRAASCLRWDDYATFATEAEMRLRDEAFGRQEAMADQAAIGATLFPQYAFMRSGGRVAIYDAYMAEQRGDIAKGLAIRHDVLAYADLMRVNSRTGIGALVAVALASMATGWPEGARPAGVNGLPAVDVAARRERALLEFAGTHAGEHERRWIAGRLSAAHASQKIVKDGTPKTLMVGPDLEALGGMWSLGIAVLAIALWCLAIGSVAFQVRSGQRTTWEAPVVVVVGLIGIVWLTWATWESARLYVSLAVVMHELTGTSPVVKSMFPGSMLFLAPLLVPAATILVSGISALAGALSRSGALRGMGIGLVWTGLAFSLLFAWVAVSTAQWEDRAQVAVRRTLQNEPRYMAELVGRPWPGP